MLNIFIINGFPGSGKTFFGDLVREEIEKLGGNFIHLSSISPIKMVLQPRELWDPKEIDPGLWDVLEEMKRSITPHDWDGTTKNNYWRGIMFDLKSSITANMPDFIHQWVLQRAKQLEDKSIIFVDIRESENITAFEDYCLHQGDNYRIRKVFVESDAALSADNYADSNLDPNQCDFRVMNNRLGVSTEQSITSLRQEALRFISSELSFFSDEPERR